MHDHRHATRQHKDGQALRAVQSRGNGHSPQISSRVEETATRVRFLAVTLKFWKATAVETKHLRLADLTQVQPKNHVDTEQSIVPAQPWGRVGAAITTTYSTRAPPTQGGGAGFREISLDLPLPREGLNGEVGERTKVQNVPKDSLTEVLPASATGPIMSYRNGPRRQK